ncbi:hypothetical protein NLC29_02090 [Candidatus Aminicenantes bacterium AH-873-B07]|nr:hypothetical protein [Candidatus Aminicenantes bacterium AH-873-B07]
MNNFWANIPLFWGKIVATLFFGGVIIWAWFRPKSYIFEGAPDKRIWRDLRIWATFLLIIQIILYLIF